MNDYRSYSIPRMTIPNFLYVQVLELENSSEFTYFSLLAQSDRAKLVWPSTKRGWHNLNHNRAIEQK
jgi:hypothetical protein